MRFLFALALVAGALVLAAGTPVHMSYTIKVAADAATDAAQAAIHKALNGPPRWTKKGVGAPNGSMPLPTAVAATAHYTDIEEDSDAVWFGVNVPDEWIEPSATMPFYWGNLNSLTKWSPGPSYDIGGGEYEVIPMRDNFTDSSSSIDYHLMINRPTNPKMLRYRLNWDADGPHWWWFGTGTQFWTGQKNDRRARCAGR